MLERINALIDDSVTDVLISSSNGVWLQRDGDASRADLDLTEDQVKALARKLIDMGGRHIDEATPCADVRLEDGVRVHAVLTPVSANGTEISIRIPSREAVSLERMRDRAHITAAQEVFLREAVTSKLTFLVSGSAGAGKTTFLAALMSCIPPSERVITIEDVAELRINHPRRVALETRQPNTEGRGAIEIPELIRQSLRMRPERLVIGECRGPEVVDMLRAFTTGHAGGGSTIHSPSLEDVATRIDSLGAMAGLDSVSLARLARAAIDLVVHIEGSGGLRSIKLGRLTTSHGRLSIEELTLAPG